MSLPKNFQLKPFVVDGLKKRLRILANGQPYNVLRAYNFKQNQLPCVVVAATEGGEDTKSIGRQWQADPFTDPDTQEQYAVTGSYYRQSVAITIISTNPTERDEDAIMLREALWGLYKEFSDINDVQKAELSEQGDGQATKEQDQVPVDVFTFTFRLAGLVPLLEYEPLTPVEGVDLEMELTFGSNT